MVVHKVWGGALAIAPIRSVRNTIVTWAASEVKIRIIRSEYAINECRHGAEVDVAVGNLRCENVGY